MNRLTIILVVMLPNLRIKTKSLSLLSGLAD